MLANPLNHTAAEDGDVAETPLPEQGRRFCRSHLRLADEHDRAVLPRNKPLGGSGFKCDSVAEIGQAFDEALGVLRSGTTVEVVGAEVLICSSVF